MCEGVMLTWTGVAFTCPSHLTNVETCLQSGAVERPPKRTKALVSYSTFLQHTHQRPTSRSLALSSDPCGSNRCC